MQVASPQHTYQLVIPLFALILRAGSNSIIWSSKSIPSGQRVGRVFSRGCRCHTGNTGFQSFNKVTPGHMSSLGVPRSRNILKSSSISESPRWYCVDSGEKPFAGEQLCVTCTRYETDEGATVPGNRGFFKTISAKMQPILQMSTAVE